MGDLNFHLLLDASPEPIAWVSPRRWVRIDQTNGPLTLDADRGLPAGETFSQPDPGEMTLTLDNVNGYLDPSNPSSPYRTFLTPGRQLWAYHLEEANKLSANESSFETSVAGWTPRTGTTIASDTVGATAGTKSMRITATAAGNALVDLIAAKPVVVGRSYQAFVHFAASATTTPKQARILLRWRDSGGAVLSESQGVEIPTGTDPRQATVGGVAPALAVSVSVTLWVIAVENGDVHYADEVVLDRRATVFWGNVERWPIQHDRRRAHETTIVVYDLLAEMGRTKPPPSLFEWEIGRGVRFPPPSVLFPLRGLADGQASQLDEMASWMAAPVNGAKPDTGRGGAALVPSTDVNGIAASPETWLSLPIEAMPAANDNWSLMMVARSDENTSSEIFFSDSAPSKFDRFMCGLQSSTPLATEIPIVFSTIDFDLTTGSAEGFAVEGPANASVFVLVTHNGASNFLRVWANATKGTRTYSGTIKSLEGPMRIGIGQGRGEMAMLGIWRSELTESQGDSLYADVMMPWASQATFQRFNALLDALLPAHPLGFVLVSNASLPVDFSAYASVLDVWRGTAAGADTDLLFTHHDGINRRPRHVLYARVRVDVALKYQTVLRRYGSGGVPVADLHITDGPEDVASEITMTNTAGMVASYHVGRSQRQPEHRREVPNVGTAEVDEMWRIAERRVFHESKVERHADEIELSLAHQSVDWYDTLDLDLYDRIEVAYEPLWGGGTVVEQAEIVHISDRVPGFNAWRRRLRVRPLRSPRYQVDVPATGTVGVDGPDIDFAGSFDVRVRHTRDDWAETAHRTLVAKLSGTTGWELAWINNQPRLVTYVGGVYREHSGSQLRYTGTRPRWLRVTWKPGTATDPNAVAMFYISENGVDWALVSTSTIAYTGTIDANAAGIQVGHRGASALPLAGAVLYAELRSAIAGPVVARFDPTSHADGLTDRAWADDLGNTWTLRAASNLEAMP